MLPLHGCRVVVTREAKQGEAWVRELTELGAEVIAFPTLRLEPPTDPGPLDRALNRLEEFDWLVFTSVNGVQYFLAALDRAGLDLRLLGTCQLAAIGPSTAAALARAHLRADLVPPQFVAESLVEAFADHPMEGRKILIPRAEQARDLLPEALRSRGAQVEVTPAYRTVVPERSQIDLESANWVTFASSSSVRHFVELVGSHRALPVLAIGPITADSARAAGFKRVEMAEVYTLAGMTQRLIELAK
jgi:uroporphyrinogen III methyltransferase/synthase